MKIYVLCPIHRRADLIQQQLLNYAAHSRNIEFILHPSTQGRDQKIIDNLLSFKKIKHLNIKFTEISAGTSFQCVFGAFVECTKMINELSEGFVYLHTDGDLIVKGCLDDYIGKYKIGFNPIKVMPDWYHFQRMMSDERFLSLLADQNIDLDDVFFSRIEGLFLPVSVWLNFVDIVKKYFSYDFFNNKDIHWPIEEVLIPTLLMKMNLKPAVHNIIITKELEEGGSRDNDRSCVNLSEVKKTLADNNECVGLKWFSQNSLSPARRYLIKLNNYTVSHDIFRKEQILAYLKSIKHLLAL